MVSQPFHITSFIFMRDWSIWYFFTQEITQWLPSILQIPDQKVFFWHNTFDIQIVLDQGFQIGTSSNVHLETQSQIKIENENDILTLGFLYS